ncbi:hypothetical protein [Draconibacterium sediminis]|uniref:Uncharacterized protein n=1 Tax=Draconibacterium sediminis TaxID=1544798 RepID=A0A0D8JD49_9BACT|nr:hypothetical protein [Draconibacterium sediminis]KJF44501.1 hypothetical protein LH29_03165 [Draconibacterium sediminis]
MKRFSFLIVLCFFAFGIYAQGLQLALTGMVTFNEVQIKVSDPGEDIEAVITANSGVQLSVESQNYWEQNNEKWRIYVHKTNVEWADEIRLEVRRQGDGDKLNKKSGGNVHDGSTFAEIKDNPTYFFRGMGLISNIPLDFRINDISLSLGANNFETDVVFTIYDD